jgi:hypothetical protein
MQKFTKVYGPSTFTRRGFIKHGALTAATLLAAPYLLRSQDAPRKINIGIIGAGGKGETDTDNVARENIIALCDVDPKRLQERLAKYPGAKGFTDYRKLLEQMGKSLDAVIIAAPDHHHGIATAMAMKMKKHVYTQKPLTQTVYEARVLRKLAAETGVVTQMGNQGSSEPGLRRAIEVIQSGVIGKVSELHVWTNRPIWPTNGLDRPKGSDPIPEGMDWDMWLGPAPKRPYKGILSEENLKNIGGKNKKSVAKLGYYYHPHNWRGWFDFGTGALGDMACHTVNMPFRALKLGYPTVIEHEAAKLAKKESFPRSSRIRFDFPQREDMAPLKFWWYDGNPSWKDVEPFRPNPELTKEILEMQDGKLPGSGCLLIGDKGKLFSPDDYGARFYVKLKDEKEYVSSLNHEACKSVAQRLPRNPHEGSADPIHHLEWLDAIRNNDPKAAFSQFSVAAYLTEIILLGCIALRHGVGKPIQWDGPNAKAKNANLSHLVKRQYRKGWEMPT